MTEQSKKELESWPCTILLHKAAASTDQNQKPITTIFYCFNQDSSIAVQHLMGCYLSFFTQAFSPKHFAHQIHTMKHTSYPSTQAKPRVTLSSSSLVSCEDVCPFYLKLHIAQFSNYHWHKLSSPRAQS